MLVYPDGTFMGTVGGGEMENRVIAEAKAALQDGQPRMLHYNMTDPQRGDPGVCGGQVDVYVEPILPKPTLVVVGSGHVGRAVAHLAKWLGFRVVVNDDRPGFATPEAVPEADQFIPTTLAELPQHLELAPWTYLVLTTRGMNVDVEGLPAILEGSPAYIGVIGSRRRWMTARKQLIEKGVAPEKLDLIRSPIGIELNAETPEEIAVSIMAEILMLRDGGTGKPMQMEVKPDKASA
jgi:xanthine dehydrogenase accessory factor